MGEAYNWVVSICLNFKVHNETEKEEKTKKRWIIDSITI